MTVLTIGLILQAEWLLVHFTNALQIQTTPGAALPPAQAAQIAVANHDYLVIMMLLGAILGMISGFGVVEPDARGQLITVLFLPGSDVPGARSRASPWAATGFSRWFCWR